MWFFNGVYMYLSSCLLLDIILSIDYEYAGMNFLPYDIGNHFCEYAGIVTYLNNKFVKKKKIIIMNTHNYGPLMVAKMTTPIDFYVYFPLWPPVETTFPNCCTVNRRGLTEDCSSRMAFVRIWVTVKTCTDHWCLTSQVEAWLFNSG